MKDQFIYQDFDLLIEPGTPGSYRARVLRSPAGESAPVQFALPFSLMELENFVLKVGRGRRRTRGPGRPESAPLKEFGGKLYGAVFQDELRDILRSSLSQTRAQGVGMRLRLRLADVPELADLPWEFLYDPRLNRFLAQSRHTPLVRYLDLPDPPQPLSVTGPLRILVMISCPSDYPILDVEQEWNALTTALAQQISEGQVVVERLPANMSSLRRRLRREEFHVFHFVGHGFYRLDWGEGVLVMEGRDGRPHEVPGEELGGLLHEYDQTRLAVLNACEGARSGTSDPFAGMAQSLIQQGLPAVVAMQFEITDDAAIIFAHELYAAIADGYPLEAALAEARGAIRDEGNLTEWGTPVLYSRAPDGRLFDLTRHVRVLEADRKAQREAEERAQREAEEKAQREAEEKAQREAEERAQRASEEKAQREAEERAQREAEERAQREAEEKAQREAEEKAQREAEEKAQREAEEKAQREAEEKAQREAEEKVQREQRARAQRERRARIKREAEERAQREAQAQAQREAEERAQRAAQERAQRASEEKVQREQRARAQRAAEEQISFTGSRDAIKAFIRQYGIDNWYECSVCGASVKGNNLLRHIDSEHSKRRDVAVRIKGQTREARPRTQRAAEEQISFTDYRDAIKAFIRQYGIDNWYECSVCGASVKGKNLLRHIDSEHSKR